MPETHSKSDLKHIQLFKETTHYNCYLLENAKLFSCLVFDGRNYGLIRLSWQPLEFKKFIFFRKGA